MDGIEHRQWINPIPIPIHDKEDEPRTRQCKPDNCPFKDYKGVRRDKAIFICDIPLEERHKYIDPEQDINHPCMKIVGHPKNKLENPLETKVKEQADMIKEQNKKLELFEAHLIQLTNQLNNITLKK